MVCAEYNFPTPTIFGIISDSMPTDSSVQELEQRLQKFESTACCLPFVIKAQYLQNTIACMQLMDIKGLVVQGNLRTQVGEFLPELDKSAMDAGFVDVISRQNSKFTGFAATSGLNKPALLEFHINLLTAD
jgi:shikimate 5-dehydrogenase